MLQPLLIAYLDAAEVQHGVLHGHLDVLASAGADSLVERRQDGRQEVDTSP